MGKLEWAMWANEQALISSLVTILCGIIATAGQFRNWQFGIYAISVGFLTFTLEYPRGKRQKGTSQERRFQRPFTIVLKQGKFLTRNYFVRFVLYLLLSVPCCFILATLIGAACYMVTALIYFLAAVQGEEWQAVEARAKESGPEVIQEPTRPPPRRPPGPMGDNQLSSPLNKI